MLTTEIPREKIQVARLGDSDRVQPGEPVIAIGSPFGFDHSVSHGIISAVDRSYGARGRSMYGLLQTDAPINPGNSGGPLLDAAGEVIGIATMIQSPIPGSVGVGFAIPVNRARALLPRLAAGEAIRHPWIGIVYRAVTPELAEQLGLEQVEGFAVLDVVPDSPAERAGLRAFTVTDTRDVTGDCDIIIAVDGKKLDNQEALARDLQTRTVGETITFTVLRDGQVCRGAYRTGHPACCCRQPMTVRVCRGACRAGRAAGHDRARTRPLGGDHFPPTQVGPGPPPVQAHLLKSGIIYAAPPDRPKPPG